MTARVRTHSHSRQPHGVTSLFTAFRSWFALRRQHRHLSELDDAALKDLGLTRGDVAREIQRPIWNAPDHWRV